jgi:hypothetical protein
MKKKWHFIRHDDPGAFGDRQSGFVTWNSIGGNRRRTRDAAKFDAIADTASQARCQS